MIDGVRVVVLDFKNDQASTVIEEDGYYTIFLNDRVCQACRERAYLHELNHILHDDFREVDVDAIERDAHEYR